MPVYPFLFAEIFASNIGGTATLIGDPPNILIGSAAHLTFNHFLINLGPPVLAYPGDADAFQPRLLGHPHERGARGQGAHDGLKPVEMILDRWILWCSLAVIAAVIAGFIFAQTLHLESATIALSGAGVLMLLEILPHRPHSHAELVTQAFHEVEWITLFFFIGLFVVVGGVAHAGLLDLVGHWLLAATGGAASTTAYGVLWASAMLSAIIDNIPFVATMIPLVKSLAPELGGTQALVPLWWALSLGACLGGNGTLVGASANLMVAGIAEKNGVRFSFAKFTLAAIPMMLASVAVAHLYLMWRYF